MQVGFIISLVFAIIVAVFALKNADIVLIDFVFRKVEISQAIVIFMSAALGAIIVTILGLIRQVKLTLGIKDLNKKVKTLESENLDLKKELENKELVELSDLNSKQNLEENKEKQEEKEESILGEKQNEKQNLNLEQGKGE